MECVKCGSEMVEALDPIKPSGDGWLCLGCDDYVLATPAGKVIMEVTNSTADE